MGTPLRLEQDNEALYRRRVEQEDATGWRHVQQRVTRLWLPIVSARYSKQRLYLQQNRASSAAASDFHKKASSLPHITQLLISIHTFLWVRFLLRKELEICGETNSLYSQNVCY